MRLPLRAVAPVRFAKERLSVGSVVSTLTVVEIETVLPTLSVPVSVYW